MAAGTRPPSRSELQRQQAEEQRHQQNQQAGLRRQQKQAGGLFSNPDVLEELTEADLPEGAQSDKAWLAEMMEEHLHKDQVFSIYDDRTIWEKQWLNQNIPDEIMTSYPFPASRSENPRVREVRSRIRGDEKEPLTPDEKRAIRALGEQKTDRERRSKGGKFMDLTLSEVVRSEQSTTTDENGGGGLWAKLTGGQ